MSELTSFLDELARAPCPEAGQGGGWYVPEGDCAVFHVEDVAYTAVRIDELLTVYRADDDGRIVGAQVKGVSRLPDHAGMGLLVDRDGEVEAVTLLFATFGVRPAHDDGNRLRGYSDAASALVGSRVNIGALLAGAGADSPVRA